MRYGFYCILLALIALTTCEGSSCQPSHPQKKLYPDQITIGTETWPGYMPLYVAEEKGFFKEVGLDVKIMLHKDLGALSKNYTGGKMQGRANLTLDAVQESLNGFNHKIVLVIDHSTGADAIIAKQDISSLKEARGKRVGYEFGTLEEFFIIWALDQNDLSLADVQSVHASPDDAVQMLSKGELDIAVSHEPFLTKIKNSDLGLHTIYTSANSPNLITDVLTLRSDFISAHPDTVTALLRAYFKAFDYCESHPDESYELAAKIFGGTKEDIRNQLKRITMMSANDNLTAFTFSAGLQSLYGNLRSTNEFVMGHDKNRLAPIMDSDTLIEKRFLKAAMLKDVSL